MFLDYEDSSLANFLIDVLESTCDEITRWTRHDEVDDLPYAIRLAIDPRRPVVCWYDCSFERRTLTLVVAREESSDARIYTLCGTDEHNQVTRIRKATEYPHSTDLLFILANQVFECARLDQNEAVSQFLDQIARDRLADLAVSDE